MIIAILISVGTGGLFVGIYRGHKRSVREWNAWESRQLKDEMYLDQAMQDN